MEKLLYKITFQIFAKKKNAYAFSIKSISSP